MSLKLDFSLDNETFRHYINGHAVVMHSHHYLALITKLAEEFGDIGGPQLLKDVVEESMWAVLDDYVRKNGETYSPAEMQRREGVLFRLRAGKDESGRHRERRRGLPDPVAYR